MGWASGALNRVDRDAFFAHFEEAGAVRYFYEPFLAAFDPELRKELGVWYTPREIVRYMVERVDRVLRNELGKPDGLALFGPVRHSHLLERTAPDTGSAFPDLSVVWFLFESQEHIGNALPFALWARSVGSRDVQLPARCLFLGFRRF